MKEWELKAALDRYFVKFEMAPRLFREIELPSHETQRTITMKEWNLVPGLVDWNSQRVENGTEHYLWHPVQKHTQEDWTKIEK